MNRLNHIKQHFSQYGWFDRVEKTAYKKEYVIFVNTYPYSQDIVIFDYERQNKIRLRIHAIL